ncbi:hypothetical protein [Microcoleus sp. MON2_D5]|uniref:hypothetical protein n=1 Tax=Microcoleus sp. MON2_D5 TaxID=2818833 RepID=UPI002FD45E67
MRSHSYSDAMGKQRLPALHILTLLHITRTAFLVRLATPPILPPTLTRRAERARQAHAVATAFSVSRNSLVRFSALPINSDSLALIRANTTHRVGFS